jgi:hypothetical protein
MALHMGVGNTPVGNYIHNRRRVLMKQTKKWTLCAGLLLGMGLFTAGLENPLQVHAQEGCTVKTLEGNYIYAQDGFNVEGQTAKHRTPFAQSGKEFFDGAGKMSGVFTASLHGQIVRGNYAGTYTVNADCTGTVTFTDNAGQTFHFDVFIADGGKEFAFIQTDAGVVTAAYERKR